VLKPVVYLLRHGKWEDQEARAQGILQTAPGWWDVAIISQACGYELADVASVLWSDRCLQVRKGQHGLLVAYWTEQALRDTQEV
jgi:hypothetical protein